MKKIIIIGLTALAFVSCSENKESENLTDENIATETKGYTIDCDFGGSRYFKSIFVTIRKRKLGT